MMSEHHGKRGSSAGIGGITASGRVQTVALSADGSRLFTAVQHLDASVWNVAKGERISRLRYSNRFFPSFSSFSSAQFSEDGSQILTGNTTGAVELWESRSGNRMKRWLTPKSSGFGATHASIVALAMPTARGPYMAMGSNGSAHRLVL